MSRTVIQTLPFFLVEDEGTGKRPYRRIPDDAFAILEKYKVPRFCVDMVGVDPKLQRFFLAKRKRAPREGWWFCGGGVGGGELPYDAASRKVLEEFSIQIHPLRFRMVATMLYYIKEEKAEQTNPVIMLAFEPTEEEISRIVVDPDEYDATEPPRWFTREEILGDEVTHPGLNDTIADLYRHMFRG